MTVVGDGAEQNHSGASRPERNGTLCDTPLGCLPTGQTGKWNFVFPRTFLTSPIRTALERANLAHFSHTGFLEKREIVQVRLIGRQRSTRVLYSGSPSLGSEPNGLATADFESTSPGTGNTAAPDNDHLLIGIEL